ncbi:hypothetical protein DVK00_20405 [Haloarcula sp. Atlit-47R]|nr:hypothetical protein DVK00_20405 [Haloarcula sp. Atlit-47R]
MPYSVSPRRLAVGTIGGSLCSLVATIGTIVTYEQSASGGTSVAGLFFGVFLIVGLLGLGSGGLLAAHTHWGQSGTWARRLLCAGAGAGAVASAVLIFWTVLRILPATLSLDQLLPPLGGPLLVIILLAAVATVLCVVLGLLAQTVQILTESTGYT